MKKDNTKEELKIIAPLLSKIEKQEVIGVDVNYFNALQDSVIQRIRQAQVLDELKLVAPLLKKIEKKQLSDNEAHFRKLQQGVFAKISPSASKEKKAKWLQSTLERMALYFTPQAQLAFSIIFVGVLLASINISQSEQKNQLEIDSAMNQLSNTEIQQYLANNADEIDEYSLTHKAELREPNEILKNELSHIEFIEDYLVQEDDADFVEKEIELI